MNINLAVAAEHEASHAVARLALATPLHSVEMDDFGLGLTLGYEPGKERSITARLYARISMTGPAIEQKYLKMTDAELIRHWAQVIEVDEDHDVARCGTDTVAGYHWAVGFITVHQDDIQRVARVLLKERYLSGDSVREIVGTLDYDERRVKVAAGDTAERLMPHWIEAWKAGGFR